MYFGFSSDIAGDLRIGGVMNSLQIPPSLDSMSTISGSTSLSMSETQDDMASLYDGLDMEHLTEERFKIDRKKLELMLFGK